jgi:hypothetical protein
MKPGMLVRAHESVGVERPNLSGRITLRNWLAIFFFSAVLIVPCWWQSRIQSADLASHIYNAWLATQIRQDKLPGLSISPQSNNILFDFLLEWLLVRLGAGLAQHIAVSLTVLVFGWGALLFIFRLAGKNWWFAAPTVAMLGYGFIFQIGFFNFYLSMGLCLWYLAIFWEQIWRIRILTAPLLAVAWLAHPFPVVWSLGIATYVAVAENVSPKLRFAFLGIALGAVLAARFAVTHLYAYLWSPEQIMFVTGADQVVVFGVWYKIPLAGLLLLWLRQLRQLAKQLGWAQLLSSVKPQLWLLTAAAVWLIPTQVKFPQFTAAFGFVTTRLSLGAALLFGATAAAAPMRWFDKTVILVTALSFFGLLFRDDLKLNRLEGQVDAVIEKLPPMNRVISPLPDWSLYSLCFQHDLDRACVGHCFSYANYEPSSGQFRIHERLGNDVVLGHRDADDVSSGSYRVLARDLPIYMIYRCGVEMNKVCSLKLAAGDLTRQPN